MTRTESAIVAMREASDAVTVGLLRAVKSACALERAVYPLRVFDVIVDGAFVDVSPLLRAAAELHVRRRWGHEFWLRALSRFGELRGCEQTKGTTT